MRCYTNYNPNPPIPIGRVNSRCVYENSTLGQPEYLARLLAYKKKTISSRNSINTTAISRYSYLIQNPPKTYGTQSDTYTNPNTLGKERVGATVISLNNNPTCTNVYPIDNPANFPSNQPSIIYPLPPPTTIPPTQCINYTALAGGTLISTSCLY